MDDDEETPPEAEDADPVVVETAVDVAAEEAPDELGVEELGADEPVPAALRTRSARGYSARSTLRNLEVVADTVLVALCEPEVLEEDTLLVLCKREVLEDTVEVGGWLNS